MSAQDLDPLETQEWLEAFKSVARIEGDDRAKFLLNQLMDMTNCHAIL
jgi:pyruvate dehydrogenase E1 component